MRLQSSPRLFVTPDIKSVYPEEADPRAKLHPRSAFKPVKVEIKSEVFEDDDTPTTLYSVPELESNNVNIKSEDPDGDSGPRTLRSIPEVEAFTVDSDIEASEGTGSPATPYSIIAIESPITDPATLPAPVDTMDSPLPASAMSWIEIERQQSAYMCTPVRPASKRTLDTTDATHSSRPVKQPKPEAKHKGCNMKKSACVQARADVRKLRDKVKDISERVGRNKETELQVTRLEGEKRELMLEMEKMGDDLAIYRSSIEQVGKAVGGLLDK